MTKKLVAPHKGRAKGTPNHKTQVKNLAKLAEATVVAAVLATSVTDTSKPRLKAQAGIEPKDLLLSTMRSHWSAAHALNLEAMATQEECDAIPPNGNAEVEEQRTKLREKAQLLRNGMQHQLSEATRLAAAVAPYAHAKLANIEQRHVGNIVVELAKF